MNFDDLQEKIGIQFEDAQHLKQAFVHRSHLNESKNFSYSNERLEFLGDSVLSLLTSQYLYETYPDFPEGILTNIRSSLVKTKSLSDIARSLGLGELIFVSHGEEESGGRENTSLLADTFEALLGAIYLDRGFETAQKFLAQYLFPHAMDIVKNRSYVDYKSLLQEIIQEKSRSSPTYRVVKSDGPDHAKTFWVEAITNNGVLAAGTGKSKQEAEQEAARTALVKMGKI